VWAQPSTVSKQARVRRHSEGKIHIAACQAMMTKNNPADFHAPPLSEFEKLTKLMSEGLCRSFAFGGGKRISSSDKIALMRWCVGEAMCEVERDFLRGAQTIMLTRDARRQRLAIRYGAAQMKDLKVRFSVLG